MNTDRIVFDNEEERQEALASIERNTAQIRGESHRRAHARQAAEQKRRAGRKHIETITRRHGLGSETVSIAEDALIGDITTDNYGLTAVPLETVLILIDELQQGGD